MNINGCHTVSSVIMICDLYPQFVTIKHMNIVARLVATETSFMVIQPAICHVEYYGYRIRWLVGWLVAL